MKKKKEDCLIEFFSEEIPAGMQESVENQIGNLFKNELSIRKLSYNKVTLYSTPRRFAIKINDLDVNQEDQSLEIKGPNIIIDASNEVVIQGRKIRLGYTNAGKCESITANATKIDMGAPQDGNISVLLKTNSFCKAFSKSMIADKVASVAGASVGFSALENKATKILNKVSSLI